MSLRDLDRTLHEVEDLLKAGSPEEAEKRTRGVVELARTQNGDLARALEVTAMALERTGHIEQARPLYAELTERFGSAGNGEELIRAAEAAFYLADFDDLAKDAAGQRAHLEAAWAIHDRVKAAGIQPASVFIAMDAGARLARLSLAQLDSTAALDWIRRTLQAGGVKPEDLADDLLGAMKELASWLKANGRVSVAASLFEELARFAATKLEPPAVSDALGALGSLLEAAGLDAAAFNAYRRAYLARPSGTRTDDLARAELLSQAGVAADRLGEYALAALAYADTLRIRKQWLAPDDPALLQSRYNRAELARVSGGDLDAAARELESVVTALRTILARDEPHEGWVVNLFGLALKNLAQARLSQRRPEDAERLIEESLALGIGGHSRRAQLLVELGMAQIDQHRDPTVLPELRQLSQEFRKAEGSNGQTYLWLIGQIAAFMPESESEQSGVLLQEVISAIGDPQTASARTSLIAALINQAGLHWQHGDAGGALDAFLKAWGHLEIARAENWRVGSALEAERDDLARTFSPVVQLVLEHLADRDEARRFAFRASVGSKALQAEVLRRQHELVLQGQTDLLSMNALASRLRAATLTLDQAGRDSLAQSAGLQQFEQLEAFETAVAARLPREALLEVFEASSAEAVSQSLPGGSVLVEYVRCPRFTVNTRGPDGSVGRADPWYVAFVLPAGRPEALALVDLGPADRVDQAVLALRAAIPGPGWREPARAAAEVGWDPLAHLIPLDATIVIAPDGQLGALPFDALVTANGLPLLMQHLVTVLATGRDAKRLDLRANWRSEDPLVVGDPEYGEPWAPFTPLPGTRIEANRIGPLLEVTAIVGPEATRDLLLGVRDPEILHLATHGYYLPVTQTDDPLAPKLLALAAKHPLVATGIALTGANQPPQQGTGDVAGVVSALDVIGLELYGTDLTVLSACESGLGPADDGEGLLSLARSFVLAGSRSVVWTLWRVDDWASADLMERFYRRILRETPRGVALRRAKRELYLREPDRPELWAGFVLQGDPDPLVRYRFVMVPEEQIVPGEVKAEGGVTYLDTRGRPMAPFELPMGKGEPLRIASVNARNLGLAMAEDLRHSGIAAAQAGRYAEAQEQLVKALDQLGEHPTVGRPLAAHLLGDLAITAGFQGLYEQALDYGLKALAAYEELHDWPMEQAVVLVNIGGTEIMLDHLTEARARYQQALAIQRAEYPAGHPSIDFTLARLAALDAEASPGNDQAVASASPTISPGPVESSKSTGR